MKTSRAKEETCDGCERPLPADARGRWVCDAGVICGACVAPRLAKRKATQSRIETAIAINRARAQMETT